MGHKSLCGTTVFNLRLSFLLILLSHFVHAAADLNKFFPHYYPDRDNANGCKKHASDLDASYKQASEMINAASAAINDLAKTKQPAPGIERWDWDRKAETMFAVFGIKIDVNGGPKKESEEYFEFVKSIFDAMKEGMDTGLSDPDHSRSDAALFCGDDGWRFYGPNDVDPSDPRRKISDRKSPEYQYPDGVWYFGSRFYEPSKEDKQKDWKSKVHMCEKGDQAITLAAYYLITWCDDSWSSSTPKAIDPKAISKSTKMDSMLGSLPGIWVHELAHFHGDREGDLPDQAAVTSGGKEVKGKATYGISYVFNLAKNSPEHATHTAEAYSSFAIAMYLSDWNWSNKKQQPRPP